MKNYRLILTGKQQTYDKIPGKLDKYEYLIGNEILSSDQSRIIEQANFTYSSLGNASETK